MNASDAKAPRDKLAVLGFYLAVIILVFPIHADLLTGAISSRNILLATLVSASCIGAVAVPTIISAKRVFSGKHYLRGKGYIYLTTGIILLNLLMAGAAFYSYFTRLA